MNFKMETEHLLIRICSKRDARMVHKFYTENLRDFGKYEVIDYSSAKSLRYYEKLLEIEYDLIGKGEMLRYYLFDRANPFEIVGTVSFRSINTADHYRSATIGYKIAGRHRRKGYATEAVDHLCRQLFAKDGIHRIEAFVLDDNPASFKMLEKCGFVREGLLRQKMKLNGKWRDHYLYARVKE